VFEAGFFDRRRSHGKSPAARPVGHGCGATQPSIRCAGRSIIQSNDGVGATITIRLAVTAGPSIDGLCGGIETAKTYVIPAGNDQRMPGTPGMNRLPETTGGPSSSLRGEPLPYVRLRDALGFSWRRTPKRRENIVVLHHEGGRAGLAVDELLGRKPSHHQGRSACCFAM